MAYDSIGDDFWDQFVDFVADSGKYDYERLEGDRMAKTMFSEGWFGTDLSQLDKEILQTSFEAYMLEHYDMDLTDYYADEFDWEAYQEWYSENNG